MRRIVLDDSEINSKDFFEGLAGLEFTKDDSGLWTPPTGIANGAVAAIISNELEPVDLMMRVQLIRPNGSVLHSSALNIRSTQAWYANGPDNAILLQNGKRLVGYQFAAHII